MPTAIQRAFSGGELTPTLDGRADQTKYQTGLKLCENFYVQRWGGVANRAGFKYLTEVKDSSAVTRLLKFVFNDAQTYVLEFGNLYMRVIKLGAQVTATGLAAYNGATAYALGDLVSSGGVNYYCIAATTGNAPPNATYWYAMPGSIYEIPTPYVTADLFDLQITQSADVITITQHNYAPRNLSRRADTTWILETLRWSPKIAAPTGVVASVGAAGAISYRYVVAAVANDSGEESLPGESTSLASTMNAATKVAYTTYSWIDTPNSGGGSNHGSSAVLTPVTRYKIRVTTAAAHGLSDGDSVYITGIIGMTELNNQNWIVDLVGATQFDVRGPDAVSYAAYASGGTVTPTSRALVSAVPTTAAPNIISWTTVPGAGSYNVYRLLNGVYGFIGNAAGTSFNDTGITPDTSLTVRKPRQPFTGTGNYPQSVGYFQQRRFYGATTGSPETVWASSVGDYQNLSSRTPLQDDDAIVFAMAGSKVNEVRHFVDIGQLVILTSGGEWIAKGSADGAILPTSVNLKQYGHNGASRVPPLIVTDSMLYIQARGSIVRDFRYDVSADGYSGRDLTVFAAHMFDGYSIIDWDYQQIPHSVCWAVRNDGTLLGLTYLREHEIVGWHRHITDGSFESVVVVPEGTEDALYAIIKRTINGSTKRYIERLHSRSVTDITVDAFFVDCGISYDGRNTTATTMQITGGTDWTVTEDLTLFASGASFVVGDVGNRFALTIGSESLFVTVLAYVDATHVTVRASRNVPVSARAVATTTWTKRIATMTGLSHLEGKTVAILGDGNVNAQQVVTGGSVSFTVPYGVAHIGLPYTSTIQTLTLENTQGETLTDKKRLVDKVTLLVQDSRGGVAGPDASNLADWRQRQTETLGTAIAPFTGPVEIRLKTTWDYNGRVMVRQTDPLPLSVLAIAPRVSVGD